MTMPHELAVSLWWSLLAACAATALPARSAPPTITPILPQFIRQGGSTAEIVFMVNDPDTPVNELVVTATSANDVLVPNSAGALALAGSGASRTIQVIPTAAHSGAAEVAWSNAVGAVISPLGNAGSTRRACRTHRATPDSFESGAFDPSWPASAPVALQ